MCVGKAWRVRGKGERDCVQLLQCHMSETAAADRAATSGTHQVTMHSDIMGSRIPPEPDAAHM
jgi:hypothetical protein